MNYIIYDILEMQEVIASIIAIYEYHSVDANSIIQSIWQNTHWLKTNDKNLYVDLLVSNHPKIQKVDFYDNQYWVNIYGLYTTNNHCIWNHLNSEYYMDLNNYVFWLQTYPINTSEYLWISKNSSSFKVYFYGFHKFAYDVSYLKFTQLQHHDYNEHLYFTTNINYNIELNNKYDLTGLYLLWLEPYGSVEIGLKVLFSYWYQIFYPHLEDYLVLNSNATSTRLTPLLTDSMFVGKRTVMIEDWRYWNRQYWGME